MDNKQIKSVLKEVIKRSDKNKQIVDTTFSKQAAFINDESNLKAALCTRRAGKSYGAGLYLFKEAYENPGTKVLYIALTRNSAKNIMWREVLKDINKRFYLDASFNEIMLTVTLPNESEIFLAGADARPDEMDKFLGQKYKLVIIDEGASFRQDLRRLIYANLKPAVADYNGTICIIGTPGNNTNNLFYDITEGVEQGWSVHKWTAFDNPYMEKKWQKEMKDMVERSPQITETPMFKQMYLGQWYIDHNKMVYKYPGKEALISALPDDEEWRYVLSIDLGYSPDPSAFALLAYSLHSPVLYVVDTWKKEKMIISDIVEEVRRYQGRYDLDEIIIDASAKQAVEEMRQRYSLPLKAAEKRDKAGFIEILNTDLVTGKIKLIESKTRDLREEWQSLIWDERSPIRVEHPNCDNHISDAVLYGWRHCYNYAWTEKPRMTPLTDQEKVEKFWEDESNRVKKNKFLTDFEEEFETIMEMNDDEDWI